MTRLKWYENILLQIEEPAYIDSPFDQRFAEFCRHCRHFVGSHKGNIRDYFELFREYQMLDESDKELTTKLLYRRIICPVCFRPLGPRSKYFRWQVILETTDALINADIDLEYIDFEYKASVREVLMKNNDASTDSSLAIEEAVLEDEMEPED
ncbi:hypothetical protein RFI_12214 [Reticulomyxa filosa]|uniref:Uncharacterized protein n=1 Tax=Reticulomyxa filosa TaxID=46433 RepID=X6NGV3_RETFI|nr:hypothetical protein RFI_12214 [Reticulomyxa filosa]|eukprot:ETO24934.1 hypothetical protein RFI_12214 [Reticulomyxa filosa]